MCGHVRRNLFFKRKFIYSNDNKTERLTDAWRTEKQTGYKNGVKREEKYKTRHVTQPHRQTPPK